MSFSLTEDQRAQLQPEIQVELEKREWAEPEDNVMAEYISVLLANGNPRDKVHSEMDDLVGADFDSSFLDWLFSTASSIVRSSGSDPSPAPPAGPSASSSAPPTSVSGVGGAGTSRSPAEPRSRRLLDTALAPLSNQPEGFNKRKMDNGNGDSGRDRKRLSDGVPGGPRAMSMSSEARGLADRLGARGPVHGQGQGRGGMQVRGAAGPGSGPGMATSMGGRQNQNGGGMNGRGMAQNQAQAQMGMNMGGFQPGFQGNMMSPGFQPFFNPGQQEMMAQMMMMQANMAQMGEMMQKMAEEKEEVQTFTAPHVRPARPPPVKVPHGTKLGSHSVSVLKPKTASTPGPIPDKPSSTALCRYSIGCSNARCTFSHPSPAADEKTGMVLSEEACEEGKKCKDAECIKSHVSPAATLGESAGPSRLLCKYQNCTNTACPFRHEDASGNPIPPPALTAAKAAKDKATATATAAAAEASGSVNAGSDNEDGDVEVVMSSKGLMDGALDDSRKDVPCRYAERCTRPDCKFTHPPSRPTPKTKSKFGAKSFAPPPRNGGIGGMNVSKKFGAGGTTKAKAPITVNKLDPAVGEFVPKPEGEVAS